MAKRENFTNQVNNRVSEAEKKKIRQQRKKRDADMQKVKNFFTGGGTSKPKPSPSKSKPKPKPRPRPKPKAKSKPVNRKALSDAFDAGIKQADKAIKRKQRGRK